MRPHEIWLNTYVDGSVTIWVDANAVGEGPTLEAALIDAEKTLRISYDDIQARLTAERERLRGDQVYEKY